MSASAEIPLPPSSGGIGSGPPRYTPIPLYPEERNSEPKQEADPVAEPASDGSTGTQTSGKPVRAGRDFARSLVVALVINLLIVLALCFTLIDLPDFGGENFLEVARSVESEDKQEQDSSDSPPPSVAVSSPSGGENSSAVGSVTTTSSYSAFELPSLPPIDSSAVGLTDTGTSLGAEDIGLSLSKADFVAIESQRKRRIREFVEGRSSGRGSGGMGVGKGVLKGLFPGASLGDGEGLVLFLDMSGSMQSISRDVESYVKAYFPKADAIHIQGCALNDSGDPFVRQLKKAAYNPSHREFYFICDLQDGETALGIRQLSHSLLGDSPKRLHIVSFDEYPGAKLQQLLDNTGGTFTYIDPVLSDSQQ